MSHELITYVADRAAKREIEALHDFHAIGALIEAGEMTYDAARDELVAAFEARAMSAGTAKTYLSQGYALAQLFPTFDDVESFADDECDGSRSLKRVYDATRDRSGQTAKTPTALVDVVLAGLANLTDASEIRRVLDAANAMLTASAAA